MLLKNKQILLLFVGLVCGGIAFAQGPPPEIAAPIDPFSVVVLVGGGAVVLLKKRSSEK